MDEPEPSRRPWFTHERAVLIALVIVAALGLGWLGWQFSIVVHRRATLTQITASGGWGPGPYQAWMRSTGPVTIRAGDLEHGMAQESS